MSSFDSELFSLADETIAALASPKKGLVSHPDIFKNKTGNARKFSNVLYKQMRQATRFVLEDELTEYVARISTTIDPERLNNMLTKIARLPTDLTWLEWNEKLRVTEINESAGNHLESGDLDHISDRVGYLCQNFEDQTAIFTMAFKDKNFQKK